MRDERSVKLADILDDIHWKVPDYGSVRASEEFKDQLDATMQPTSQHNHLMSKHRVLSFKPQLRLERRGQDGQNETEQPDHSSSLGDSITSSTRIRFSVHTARRDASMRGPTTSAMR
jgi:hypothetical protein